MCRISSRCRIFGSIRRKNSAGDDDVHLRYTEVRTKLEVLNDELSVKNQRNPIEMIKSRVKKPLSIVEKLRRRGLEVSLESMIKNLDDVAGVRIICSFLDDIYEVAEMLVRQDDVNVIAVKDYIKKPKATATAATT